MISLATLLDRAGVCSDATNGDPSLSAMTADSRQVTRGALFICMPSPSGDTHRFIPEAASKGAVAVLAHSREGYDLAVRHGLAAALIASQGLPFQDAVWRICREFYGSPSRDMQTVAVTGTNGKTTVAWLLRDMLAYAGKPSAYLGTLGFQLPRASRELNNTTPFAPETYSMIAEARTAGVKAFCMEVSSHALAERRADGVEFDAAVFTNLSQDHLDYHGTMDEYREAKFRLFSELPKQTDKPFVSVLNMDDPVGRNWSKQVSTRRFLFGNDGPDLAGRAESIQLSSIELVLRIVGAEQKVSVPLGGTFNVKNCVAASAGMLALGYPLEAVCQALSRSRPVPGRFEPVPNDRGIGVIVDYAHTPDALEKLLDSVRALHPRRIFTVFGCGGDRDRTKRPIMARAASERSDVTVITSDNPRTENPESILREIETGLVANAASQTILDRREAIEFSVRSAEPGDVVVIAGKGHEDYQIVGKTKHHMDDREIAREVLAR